MARAGLVMLVIICAFYGCAWDNGDRSSAEASDDGWKTMREQSKSSPQEPTLLRGERQVLTGIVTGRSMGRILVEEDPDANCGNRRGPLKPGCEKMYFDITGKTSVFRRAENAGEAMASASNLEKGSRVSADYSGYDVAESYPSQTEARVVTVLGTPRQDRRSSD